MDIEKEIVSYLRQYGNTKESDVINYGVRTFNYTPKRMKRVIKQMTIKDKIHFIVHDRLQPPEVYISLEEPLPPETTKILLEALHRMKIAQEDVQTILEEAAAVAEQKGEKNKTRTFYKD